MEDYEDEIDVPHVMVFGLTQDEFKDWCKDKAEYKPLIRILDKTPEQKATLNRMARECRDYHRRIKMERKSKKAGDMNKRFNPKLHTSKIFADIPGYTGGGQ